MRKREEVKDTNRSTLAIIGAGAYFSLKLKDKWPILLIIYAVNSSDI
jgi:hypothetical protein